MAIVVVLMRWIIVGFDIFPQGVSADNRFPGGSSVVLASSSSSLPSPVAPALPTAVILPSPTPFPSPVATPVFFEEGINRAGYLLVEGGAPCDLVFELAGCRLGGCDSMIAVETDTVLAVFVVPGLLREGGMISTTCTARWVDFRVWQPFSSSFWIVPVCEDAGRLRFRVHGARENRDIWLSPGGCAIHRFEFEEPVWLEVSLFAGGW